METFLLLVAFFGFLLASISDIKSREVPDYLSYLLFGIGFLARSFWIFEDANILLYPLLLSVASGAISYLLYKMGQWGGGDVKLIVASAMLIGYFPGREFLFSSFILYLMSLGVLYSVSYSLLVGLIKRAKAPLLSKFMVFIGVLLGILCLNQLPAFINIISAIACFSIFSMPYIKHVERLCFIKEIPVEKLTEGDWITKPISLPGDTINPKGTGLTKNDLKLLKERAVANMLVEVREGVPFVPSFLIALIASYFFPIASFFV